MPARLPDRRVATSGKTAGPDDGTARRVGPWLAGRRAAGAPVRLRRQRPQPRRARTMAPLDAADLDRGRHGTDAPARRPALKMPRLLIVDDDVGAIEVMHRALGHLGICHFATSGAEAIALAGRFSPDIILLDGYMPGVDGFTVCATLKAWPSFSLVPIIFVTGFPDPVNEQRARDLGAADFIVKPYLPAGLQARVCNLLGLMPPECPPQMDPRKDNAQRHAADAAGQRRALMKTGTATDPAGMTDDRQGCAESTLTGALELRSLDGVDCARAAVAAVAGVARQAGVAISTRFAASTIGCIADADRLHRCLMNLLNNAVRYNRPGGWVRIEVQRQGEVVAIAVRDDGPGMDAAQRPNLFEPSSHVGPAYAAFDGGPGLVATRHLVRAMNGQLRVDSEPGRGSCFTIALPLASDGAVR
jgi:CheY-like chemotaxis protein